MRALLEDLRGAWRSCRARPVTSLGIVLILSLGIGPSTSVSAMIDVVLLRRLPVEDPGSLVRVYNSSRRGAEEYWSTSYPIYRDYAEQSRSFRGLAIYREGLPVDLSGKGRVAERIRAAMISGNGFGVLGVRADRGRAIQPQDDRPEATPVIVISHALWQQRFGGSQEALGEDVAINGNIFKIVGIAPKGFRGLDLVAPVEIWAPFSRAVEIYPPLRGQIAFRSTASFSVFGRLTKGVTRKQAEAELETIASRLGAGRPPTRFEGGEPFEEPWPRVVPIAFSRSRSLERLSAMVTATVLLVLLTACLNVAGLLLVRSERNRRDTALRLALGAPRYRLVRRIFLETLLYGIGGALGGGLLALWSAEWLGRLAPPELPLPALHGASASASLALTCAAALLASLLVGLVPAQRLLRRHSFLDLWKDLPAHHTAGRRPLAQRVFVTLQVAACAVLIASAGLFVRGLRRLEAIDPGVDADHVVISGVSPARAGYSDAAAERLLDRLLARLRELPETRVAALALTMPPFTESTTVGLGKEHPPVGLGVVSPGYFDALGIRRLRGRDFEAGDRKEAPTVAIVNRAFAERFWPGTDPIGRVVDSVGPDDRPTEVVGVVENVRNEDLLEPPGPAVYVPIDQFFRSWSWQRGAAVIVAARSAPRTAAAAMRSAIAAADPNLFVEPMTVRESLAQSFERVRFLALLLSVFGGLVVAIAATGLGALIANEVAARRLELAVRAALGARPADLQRLVLGQGMGLVGAGLALGLPGAVLLGKGLSAATFGVPPVDLLTLSAAAGILAAIGLAASIGPALRAARARIAEVLRAN